MLGDNPYTLFGCDDALFIGPVAGREIADAFDDDVLGFSLRLGLNVTRSMFSGALRRPTFLPGPDGLLSGICTTLTTAATGAMPGS